MKLFHRLRLLLFAVAIPAQMASLQAQLAITEAMSSASTNLGPNQVTPNSDFWELTNFGTNTIDLTGYRFDDSDNNLAAADSTPFQGLSIGPGESILFVQNNVNTNAASFRAWWGANLPANVKIVFYTGNGLSSAADGLRLWGPDARNPAEVVDSVDFGEALRGSSFTYDPATGKFGAFSTNGVNGAFKAQTADDVGSPGRTTGPTPLTILEQPKDVVVNPGDTASFSVVAQSRPRGKFQWYFQSSLLAGATNATLDIPNAQEQSSGPYHVTIDNGVNLVTSADARLILRSQAAAPIITEAPSDLMMTVGQSFTFHVVATGLPQPAIQWQFEGRDLAGATTTALSLAGATEQDSGLYAVIARNAIGAATNTFRVTVTQKPQLVITEVMSSSSTNVAGHNDWWELTNLGTFPVSLKGFRFDDNSEALSSAFTFTNDTAILPGESVIFAESMTPETFRAWWGAENLPPRLQIIPYQGNGLSSAGDAVNVWNAAASEDSDKIASVVFSTATTGASFGYNPDTAQFGSLSVDGTFGAFAAPSGGDIGSPGYIRNGQRSLAPRFTKVALITAGLQLTWSAQSGTNYTLQFKTRLQDAAWTTLTNMTATGPAISIEDTVASDQRFYRVVAGP